MAENEIKKILIIRLSALGDTIHTLPAVYALRQKYPNAQIDWIVEDKASKFIENNPLINNVYIINKKELTFKSFFELIKQIRNEQYDVALDFQQLFKSGILLGLSGAKRRITLDGGREFSWIFANEIIKTVHKLFAINYPVINRNLDLAGVLDCDTEEIKFVLPDFTNEYSIGIKSIIERLDNSKKTLVLSPATTWENKHWSIEGWQSLIKEFKNDCNIIITASSEDKKLVNTILTGFENSNVINLTGLTNLYDLAYVFKHSDCIVSPDSGSAHLAWAVGAKAIVTLFFATSKKRTAPFGKNYVSFAASVSCSPCMKRKCKLKIDKNKCINSIKTENVIKVIKKLLA